MRRSIILGATLLAGCADILGIQDRYFDGGPGSDSAVPEGGAMDAAGDVTQADGPSPEGGACGTCTANGAGCVVVACHQNTATAVTVAGGRVYWANSSPAGSNNAVWSADTSGNTPMMVLSAGGNEIPSLVTLGSDVYSSTFAGGNIDWLPSGNPIASVPFAETIGVDSVDGLLAFGSFGSTGGVYTCSPSPPTVCASYEAVPNQANVAGTAIDASNVYFSTTTGTPGIYSCAWAAQCNSPHLVAASPSPTLVAVDGTFVYWVDGSFSSASIYKMAKDGTGSKTGLATEGSSILSFVVDGGFVYYATIGGGTNGRVTRVKTDGSMATDLATGLRSAAGVAVDTTYAYFTEWGPFLDGGFSTDGRVMRVPR